MLMIYTHCTHKFLVMYIELSSKIVKLSQKTIGTSTAREWPLFRMRYMRTTYVHKLSYYYFLGIACPCSNTMKGFEPLALTEVHDLVALIYFKSKEL